MRIHLNRFVFAFLALALVACGKDRNLEDYQRDKLQQNLGLYEAKAGTYTGLVRSKRDGRVLGAMQLDLSAQVKNQNSNDGSVSPGSPILVGNITFLDQNEITLTAPNGYYDPNSNLYHADIQIARAGGTGGSGGSGGGATGPNGNGNNGTPNPGGFGNTPGSPGGAPVYENVTITGQLLQPSLIGEIQSQNYPEYGGRIELYRNGGSIYDVLRKVRPGERRREEEDASKVSSYSGTTLFRQGTDEVPNPSRYVRVVLTRQTYNTSEDFLDLISPIKYVQASLNYSDSLRILFPRAIFDTRQGYLTAQTALQLNGQLNQMTIDCHQSGNKLNCTHLTSGGGVAATTVAELDAGDEKNPGDQSGDLKAVTRTFRGTGNFYPGQQNPIRLLVTFPARTKLQQLLELFFPVSEYGMYVTVRFSEVATPAFSGAKWDTVNGILDAAADRQGNGRNYTQQLQCSNFYFLKQAQKGQFTCDFFSSSSHNINMTFDPTPYRDDQPKAPSPAPAPPKKKKRRG